MRNGLDGVTPENAKRAFSGAFVTRGKTDFELFHYSAKAVKQLSFYSYASLDTYSQDIFLFHKQLSSHNQGRPLRHAIYLQAVPTRQSL